ncbi:MAG: hypothetical protein ACYTFH_01105, partial [Planctomycetota bacterium]
RRDDLMPGDPALPQIREYWRCRFEGDLWVWVFREVTRDCRERACPSGHGTGCGKHHANDRVDFRREDRWFLHGIWA